MTSWSRRRLVWLAGWFVLTFLVFLAARTVDWAVVLESTRNARWAWLAAAVPANAAILLLATTQWLVFLPREHTVGRRTMFGIVAVVSSVTNGGPPLAGSATGLHLLHTRGRVSHAAGLALLVQDQLAEGVAKVSLIVLAASVAPISLEYRATVTVLAVGVPALWLGAALAAHKAHLLDGAGAERPGLIGRVLQLLADTAHYLEAVREPARLAKGILLALSQKAAEGLGILFVVTAFGVMVPWWVIPGALVAVNLASIVSVTPANLGPFEAAATLVYLAAGLTPEMAVTLAIVQHGAYLLPLAGTGWLLESGAILRTLRRGADREA